MNILKSKKALSTVVTTLIILVVSVLLATVVTFYAINVVTTRVQEESLQISKMHIWQDGATSQMAFLLVNTGGRDVVIDKVACRGQESPWANLYYNKTTDTINVDIPYSSVSPPTNVTLGPTDYALTAATDDLTLKSGWSIIFYVVDPDHVSTQDIGVTIGVTLFTANAQYYKEANVEAVVG